MSDASLSPPSVAKRFRRDLTMVSTASLERNSAELLRAVHKLDGNFHTNTQPLKDGLVDVEAELIDRLIEEGRDEEESSESMEAAAMDEYWDNQPSGAFLYRDHFGRTLRG